MFEFGSWQLLLRNSTTVSHKSLVLTSTDSSPHKILLDGINSGKGLLTIHYARVYSCILCQNSFPIT